MYCIYNIASSWDNFLFVSRCVTSKVSCHLRVRGVLCVRMWRINKGWSDILCLVLPKHMRYDKEIRMHACFLTESEINSQYKFPKYNVYSLAWRSIYVKYIFHYRWSFFDERAIRDAFISSMVDSGVNGTTSAIDLTGTYKLHIKNVLFSEKYTHTTTYQNCKSSKVTT